LQLSDHPAERRLLTPDMSCALQRVDSMAWLNGF
jgi:hypothetical protein